MLDFENHESVVCSSDLIGEYGILAHESPLRMGKTYRNERHHRELGRLACDVRQTTVRSELTITTHCTHATHSSHTTRT
jgi:hypothetical protein